MRNNTNSGLTTLVASLMFAGAGCASGEYGLSLEQIRESSISSGVYALEALAAGGLPDSESGGVRLQFYEVPEDFGQHVLDTPFNMERTDLTVGEEYSVWSVTVFSPGVDNIGEEVEEFPLGTYCAEAYAFNFGDLNFDPYSSACTKIR